MDTTHRAPAGLLDDARRRCAAAWEHPLVVAYMARRRAAQRVADAQAHASDDPVLAILGAPTVWDVPCASPEEAAAVACARAASSEVYGLEATAW